MINPNYRCYVYYNIGKGPNRGLWSVKQKGIVCAHLRHVLLSSVRFLVGKAGRERVRREGVKNVHAGVSGYWLEPESVTSIYCWEPVTYNPYKYETFVHVKNKNPIHEADFADLCVDCPDKVLAIWKKGKPYV